MERNHIQQICLLEDTLYEKIKDYNRLFTFIDSRRTTHMIFLKNRNNPPPTAPKSITAYLKFHFGVLVVYKYSCS